jgi:hypothetical protein
MADANEQVVGTAGEESEPNGGRGAEADAAARAAFDAESHQIMPKLALPVEKLAEALPTEQYQAL